MMEFSLEELKLLEYVLYLCLTEEIIPLQNEYDVSKLRNKIAEVLGIE